VAISNPPDRDWTVAPGELLAELLQERDISQSELARRMGRPTKTINEIVNGKAAITPQTAIQLERVLGTSARFWVNAEAAYRHDLARFAEAEALEGWAAWLNSFPVKELVREKLLDRAPVARQVEQLLQFFGVGSPEAWEAAWGKTQVAYRQAGGEFSPESRTVWLRWGELVAAENPVAPFDRDGARRAMGQAVRLSVLTPPEAAVDELRELLSEVGVSLVLLPEISGTRLSGAAHWPSPDRPIVQLSGRHRSDDHFWFTALHELAHMVDSPQRDFADVASADGRRLEPSLDSADEEAEERANRMAREALVPSDALQSFLEHGRPDDRKAVRAFARELGVAPGIVVGRLQRDGLLDWKELVDLKRKYELN
jgi:HTH-type transcriptional regulator / antitoxin HigA